MGRTDSVVGVEQFLLGLCYYPSTSWLHRITHWWQAALILGDTTVRPVDIAHTIEHRNWQLAGKNIHILLKKILQSC